MRRFVLPTALMLLAVSAVAQQPFEEKIDVNAVLLDVIVTDAKGNQILGLGKDDFVITENGATQSVDSVDYVTSRILLEEREQTAPFQVERVEDERYFVFFFDRPNDPGLLGGELMVARQAVRKFVREEMKENDRVAIAGHDTRLKIYSDFTPDRAKLERALADATRFGAGLTKVPQGEEPSILRGMNLDAMTDRTGTVYQALDVLADALTTVRARKNLVLFSPGIVETNETVRSGLILDRSRYVDPMLESLNAANVSVYSIQLQRDAPNEPVFHQRLSEISTSTGGHYFQFNTAFDSALNRIENTNSGYYVVTYRSSHPKGERGFQKVGVSLRNPEMRVVARSGYQFGG